MNAFPGEAIHMVEIPDSLVERLKRRETTLVSGLGCSELAGAPGWAALVAWLAGRVPDQADRAAAQKLVAAGRIADAVFLVRASLGPSALAEVIREAYPEGAPVPAAIGAVAGLPWRAVVTTGFDDIWERALGTDGKDDGNDDGGHQVLKGAHAPSPAAGNGNGAPLLHLFGSVGLPESLFGPGDARGGLPPSGGLDWLDQLHRGQSLVMVGFRASDPDLYWLTSRLSPVSSAEAPHFLFLDVSRDADPVSETRLVALRTGMNVIPCPGGTAEAFEKLAQLSGRLDAAVAAFDRDIDVGDWLERWRQNRLDPEPREVLARAAAALRFDQKWPRLIGLLLGRADLLDDRDEQVATLQEAAAVFRGPLGAPDRALTTGLTALRLAPTNERLWQDLLADAAAAGAWEELCTEAAEIARAMGSNREAARLWRQVARAAWHELDRPHAARAAYCNALEAEPGLAETRDELCELLGKLERWEDLVDALRKGAAEAEDPARASKLMLRAAETIEERISDPIAAISLYEGVLAIDPESGRAWDALERLYEQQKRWTDLATVLQSRARRAPPSEVPALRRRRAQVLADLLGETDAAAVELELLVASDPQDRTALLSLEQLYAKAARHEDQARVLRRLVGQATEGPERLTWLDRLVALCASRPADLVWTAEALEHILGIEPRHAGAIETLTELYQKTGQSSALADLLQRQVAVVGPGEARMALQNRLADLVSDPKEKARLMTDAGSIAVEHLREENRAADLFARALVFDPENIAAAERLADLLFFRRQWGELESVLDLLLRLPVDGAAPRAADLQFRLAVTCRELGKPDKALVCFIEAHRLAPDSLPILTAYADLRFQRGDWKEARDLYASVLRSHQSPLPAADLLRIMMSLGRCESEQGETVAAADWFAKCQRLDPRHRPAIEALARLHAATQDWAALIKDKRALKALAGNEEQARLLEEIGDLYFGQLQEVLQAAAAFEAAVELEPARRSALHKLLQVHTQQQNWRQAADTLVRLAEVDEDPQVRAKSLFAAALIHRDQLHHSTEAADLLERVLDESPAMTEAFDALEKLHRSQSDWAEMARTYRRMIRRLPAEGQNDLRLRVWSELAELASKRLRNREAAIGAFEAASSLDPRDLRYQERLADLYMQGGPAERVHAIAAHQRLIAGNPNRLASYRALARLYGETGDLDKQWCLAATLSFLRKADAASEALYQQHRPPELHLPVRPFTEEVWERMRHSDEDPVLGALFALVGAYLAVPAARIHAAVGLRRKRRVDLVTDPRLPVRALAHLVATMNLPAPEVFLLEEDGSETAILNLQDRGILTPTLVLGRSTLWRRDDFELVFDLGKRLAFLRPERFLRCALPTSQALNTALRVALALGGVALPGDQEAEAVNREVERLAQHVRRFAAPQALEQLAVAAPRFVSQCHGRREVDNQGDLVDFEKWIVATDLTASRAALLLTGDLWAAARVLSGEPGSQSPLPVKDRLKDLIAFSVSEDYFICRRLLGTDVA